MRDLRKYDRQTQNRLLIGLLILVSTLGLGLIYMLYGPEAAGLGVLCLLGILLPIGAVTGILILIERFVKKHDQ